MLIVAKRYSIFTFSFLFSVFSLFFSHQGYNFTPDPLPGMGGGMMFSWFFLFVFWVLLCWVGCGVRPEMTLWKKEIWKGKWREKGRKKAASASQIGTEGRAFSAMISLLFLEFLFGPEDKWVYLFEDKLVYPGTIHVPGQTRLAS